MKKFICLVLAAFLCSPLGAQQAIAPGFIFGESEEPGYQLQRDIKSWVKRGYPLRRACRQVLTEATAGSGPDGTHSNTQLTDTAIGRLMQDRTLSEGFLENIARVAMLSQGTKLTIEQFPEKVVEIIYIGVTLYPQHPQIVLNAALTSSDISEQDALLAALSAGADPGLISQAPAAGTPDAQPTPDITPVAPPATPLGPGVGSGGAGGGDTTASQN